MRHGLEAWCSCYPARAQPLALGDAGRVVFHRWPAHNIRIGRLVIFQMYRDVFQIYHDEVLSGTGML